MPATPPRTLAAEALRLEDLAPRYVRQIMLSEVGLEGQRAICSAAAPCDIAGPAGDAARRYARRAGFARLTPGEADVDTLAPGGIVETPAARAIVAGARAALRAMVAVSSAERTPAHG